VVIKLPGGKNVVVDAKVALTAFLDANECDDDAPARSEAKDHAVRSRTTSFASATRATGRTFQPAPDIVVMFVPGEALLSAALQHDPALLEFSMTKGVMLASPLTLIALLRAIAYGWQQEKIAAQCDGDQRAGPPAVRSHREAREHFENVGKSLAKAVGAYNGAGEPSKRACWSRPGA
jgi:DNA recombination protein RmuC